MGPRETDRNLLPIPFELFQYSGQFMTGVQFVSAMRLVTRRFHGLFKSTNNQFWAELYRRDFGPLPSDTVTDEVKDASRDETIDLDFKIQYIAAHLNQCACEEPRNDIAQIKFRRLHEFLLPHANKNWAKFYLAKMLFHGQGMMASDRNGLRLLHDCLAWYDYRASIMIVNILLDKESYGIKIPHVDFVVESVKSAYKQGYFQAASTLGLLYANGYFGLSKNAAESEQWYLKALAANMSGAIDCLMDLKFNNDQAHSGLPRKDRYEIETSYLNKLLTQYPKCPMVIGDIHFTLARMHAKGSETYLAHMQSASDVGHFPAKRQLGKYYLRLAKNHKLNISRSQEELQIAISLFEEGVNAQQPLFISHLCSAYEFAQALQGSDLNPKNICTNLMEDSRKNNKYLISQVSFYINNFFKREEWIDDAEIIWWLQLAAQSGNDYAYTLLSHEMEYNAYILCALGIIRTYGIMGAKIQALSANQSRANDYFARALERDENSLEKYLKTGREIGFICKEVELLLEKQIEIHKTHGVSISKL